MKEVKLWYAYNEKDEVVRIEDIKEDEKYHCPCCGEGVYPKALNSKKVTMHFCHENGKSCSINGGENFIHKFVKEVAFQKGQQIKVNTEDGIKEYTIDEIILEKSYKTSLGDYRPDITLLTKEGERIFIEICNTNRKSIDKYWGKWLYLSNMVIELKAKDLINNKFEIGILEPIFPTFENMSNSDWKSLTGHSVTTEERRRFLTNLYKAIYDWKNGEDNLDDIAFIIMRGVEYLFNKFTVDAFIDKYICSGIDKEIILETVNNNTKIWGIIRAGNYSKFSKIIKSLERIFNIEYKSVGVYRRPSRKYPYGEHPTKYYKIKDTKIKWNWEYGDSINFTKFNKTIAMLKETSLEYKILDWINAENKTYLESIGKSFKPTKTMKDNYYLRCKDDEIKRILNVHKKIFPEQNNDEDKIKFIKLYYNVPDYYLKDLELLYNGVEDLVNMMESIWNQDAKEIKKIAEEEIKREEEKKKKEKEEIKRREEEFNYQYEINKEKREAKKIKETLYDNIEDEALYEILKEEEKIWKGVNKKLRSYFNIYTDYTVFGRYTRSEYYIDGKHIDHLDFGYGGDLNGNITIASFKNNVARIKSVIYDKPIEYYLENESELYEGVEDLLQELKDNNIK